MKLKTILIVVAALVVVYMGKSIFVDPRVSNYNDDKDAFDSAAIQLESRIGLAQAVEANREEIEAEVAEFVAALPAEVDIDIALGELRSAFDAAGVMWTSFAPRQPEIAAPAPTTTAPPEDDGSTAAGAATDESPEEIVVVVDPITEIEAGVAFSGTHLQVRDALDALRSMERLVSVNSVTMRDEGGVLSVNAELNLFVYDVPLPPEPETPGV